MFKKSSDKISCKAAKLVFESGNVKDVDVVDDKDTYLMLAYECAVRTNLLNIKERQEEEKEQHTKESHDTF